METATALFHEVFRTYGIPEDIVSDRGSLPLVSEGHSAATSASMSRGACAYLRRHISGNPRGTGRTCKLHTHGRGGNRTPNPGGEDSFKLHSVDLELEAMEKQIRDLQVKQAKLRQRKATLESGTTQPGCSSSGKRKPSTGRGPLLLHCHPPVFEISTQNYFATLRETECDTVIIGDSIVRHVRAAATKGKLRTRCLPGARILDVSAQVPAILKKNIGAVVLHAGTNNIRLRQMEILKKDFRSLVEKTLPPALPEGPRGVARPAERHSLSSVSWVFPGASSRWGMPGTPPQGDVPEASKTDA
ncbi:hypothetical protein QTP86_004836 [Hemibagrus guttatus]|nr:hypothetical protein QTP86_004836 [Hemibagrus guttatus]